MDNQTRIQTIRSALIEAFSPQQLEVIDESHHHIGHAGSRDGRGHFAVIIQANCFANKKRVEAHRMIYTVLGDLMKTDIHALRIEIL